MILLITYKFGADSVFLIGYTNLNVEGVNCLSGAHIAFMCFVRISEQTATSAL
jgi:hypothetical protein